MVFEFRNAMIGELALGSYAALVGIGGPRLLPRLWPSEKMPRRTIALLLVLSYSLPFAAISAGLVLGSTVITVLKYFDSLSGSCEGGPSSVANGAAGPTLGALGMLAATLLLARICYCLLVTFLRAGRTRRAHLSVLQLAGRPDETLHATVLDHDEAASYCLPGRPGRIVVTSKAIELLSADQLDAVLAHEQAHLRGHHHVLITLSAALHRAVPGVRMLRYTRHEVRRMVELIADDAAARGHGRLTVAAALATIGTGHAPGGALGIAEEQSALARITRMASPVAMMKRRHAVLSVFVLAAVVTAPLALGADAMDTMMPGFPDQAGDNLRPPEHGPHHASGAGRDAVGGQPAPHCGRHEEPNSGSDN
ncbi:MAG TPA: M56 family metallopeptidase [Actinospica sp.]|nr:M56 family metallopeptidase [Actinospica sp.]